MKKICLFLGVCLLYFACKKESQFEQLNPHEQVKSEARSFIQKHSINKGAANLDWATAHEGKIKEDGVVLVVKDKENPNQYLVAVRNAQKWNATTVTITKDISGKSGQITSEDIEGNFKRVVPYVDGKSIGNSGGMVKGMDGVKNKVLVAGDGGLPEVIVYAVRYLGNPIALNSLYWLLNENPDYWDLYVDLDGNDMQFYVDAYSIAYEIEFDDSMDREAIDLARFLNCFGNVPSAGATYSVTLSADIPVNGKPNYWINGLNPGHTFLTLTKSNGSQSVTQVFGFYPQSGPKSMTFDPVASAVKNDSGHETDASITMPNITAGQFNNLLSQALIRSAPDYDLNDYNCTNFALDVFNSIRPYNEITVPNNPLFGGIMPGGLYNKLNTMKNGGGAEAANINMSKTTAPASKGACP